MRLPDRLEEGLDAVHQAARLAADLQLAIDVVAEHLCDGFLDLDFHIGATVHLLCALEVGVLPLDGLAALHLHVLLATGNLAQGLPLCVGEEAKVPQGVDHLVVHHPGDRIEELLVRHARLVDGHRQGDDRLAIFGVEHALDQGVVRCTIGAQQLLCRQPHI